MGPTWDRGRARPLQESVGETDGPAGVLRRKRR